MTPRRKRRMPRLSIACIIIAHERRRDLLPRVAASALVQSTPFDEVIVVADWAETTSAGDVRWLHVAPLTRSTTDALVKRDVGTLAASSDILVYLCDDHALAPDFVQGLRAVADEPWDIIVPNRWADRMVPCDDAACSHTPCNEAKTAEGYGRALVQISNGEFGGYCGGHAGVFRRALVQRRPWSTMKHDRLWDLLSSVVHRYTLGATVVLQPRDDISVIDIEPGATPWK
jgi:hypothetical protein